MASAVSAATPPKQSPAASALTGNDAASGKASSAFDDVLSGLGATKEAPPPKPRPTAKSDDTANDTPPPKSTAPADKDAPPPKAASSDDKSDAKDKPVGDKHDDEDKHDQKAQNPDDKVMAAAAVAAANAAVPATAPALVEKTGDSVEAGKQAADTALTGGAPKIDPKLLAATQGTDGDAAAAAAAQAATEAAVAQAATPAQAAPATALEALVAAVVQKATAPTATPMVDANAAKPPPKAGKVIGSDTAGDIKIKVESGGKQAQGLPTTGARVAGLAHVAEIADDSAPSAQDVAAAVAADADKAAAVTADSFDTLVSKSEALSSSGTSHQGPAIPLHGTTQMVTTSAAQVAAQAQRAAPRNVPLSEQVAGPLFKAAANGDTNIKIELRPENLGKIDIKIEAKADKSMTVTVTADNPDTLNLLRRDSGSLEQALQDAGVKTDSGTLNFNLREGNTGAQDGQGTGVKGGTAANAGAVEEDDPIAYNPRRRIGGLSAVDISV